MDEQTTGLDAPNPDGPDDAHSVSGGMLAAILLLAASVLAGAAFATVLYATWQAVQR